MKSKMTVTIDKKIYEHIPDFNVLAYIVTFESVDKDNIEKALFSLKVPYQLDEVTTIPKIKEVRDIYKKMGLDPSHTRCAQEALIRRVIKGNMYQVSPIVDLGNILSVETLRSVCVADIDKINDIFITIGQCGERIQAIKRESINVCNMIVYKTTDLDSDDFIFGSTTSDSITTAVTDTTTNYLIMIIIFTKESNEEDTLFNILNSYTKIKTIQKIEVI